MQQHISTVSLDAVDLRRPEPDPLLASTPPNTGDSMSQSNSESSIDCHFEQNKMQTLLKDVGFIMKSVDSNESLRSLHWMRELGLLRGTGAPEQLLAEWSLQMRSRREAYEQLSARLRLDPASSPDDACDLTINNPLSIASESPWSRFFQDSELCKLIEMDLTRTHPSDEFFQSKSIQSLMLNVLFIWSKCNEDVSYRQGMNELLSPIVLTVSRAADAYAAAADNDKDEHDNADVCVDLATLFDRNYMEHDSFSLFEAVMKRMKVKFQTGQPRDADDCSVLARSEFVQNKLLKQTDPILSKHLKKIDIQPQLYGLRWQRLLLAREFSTEDVLMLWDAIFSMAEPDATHFSFVEYIAVAMLAAQRDALLASDNSGCLRLLLSYSAPCAVVKLIAKAHAIAAGSSRGVSLEPASESVTERRGRVGSASPALQSSSTDVGPSGSPPHLFKPLATVAPERAAPRAPGQAGDDKRQLIALKASNQMLGRRLDSIIGRMQTEIVKSSPELQVDALLQCLAEAKLIKDVLMDLLPIESALCLGSSSPQ